MATNGTDIIPQQVAFSAIWCPLPATLHSNLSGIEDRLLEWAKHFNLLQSDSAIERFYKIGYGRFAAWTYPRAEQLDLMAQWIAYTWILDDRLDELYIQQPEQRAQQLQDLLNYMPIGLARTPSPTGPLSAAIDDLWSRTANSLSETWRRRYVSHYRDWLISSVQAASRSSSPPSNLQTFFRTRRIQSGVELSFDLIEAGNLVEVPSIVADSDLYRNARLAANDVLSWTNDIFSIQKEIARGDHNHLVAALRHVNEIEWEEAVEDAVRMTNAATLDFLSACEELRSARSIYNLDDPSWNLVEDSLVDLGSWISGSLAWHKWSPRYREVQITPRGELPSYLDQDLN
jgi:hypothetical protein